MTQGRGRPEEFHRGFFVGFLALFFGLGPNSCSGGQPIMLNSLACVQFRGTPQKLSELPLFVLNGRFVASRTVSVTV